MGSSGGADGFEGGVEGGKGVYNPALDPGNDETRGAIHRQMLAEGGVADDVKGTMALDALARGDVALAVQVTQELEQSGDEAAVRQAQAIKEAMADLAEGKDVGENETIHALLNPGE